MAKRETQTSSTFVSIPLGDYKEKEVLPEGEYDLIIESAERIEDPGKKPRVSIRHSIDGYPNAQAVFHNIFLELSDDPEKANTQMGFIRSYLELAGIEYGANGFDPEAIEPGTRFTCTLTQNEYEGKISNQIKLRL